jgi:hypothetical protein
MHSLAAAAQQATTVVAAENSARRQQQQQQQEEEGRGASAAAVGIMDGVLLRLEEVCDMVWTLQQAASAAAGWVMQCLDWKGHVYVCSANAVLPW